MIRRQFQLDDSTFWIEARNGAWWVDETWHYIDRRGDKDQDTEVHGPFPDKEAAQAEIARLEEL